MRPKLTAAIFTSAKAARKVWADLAAKAIVSKDDYDTHVEEEFDEPEFEGEMPKRVAHITLTPALGEHYFWVLLHGLISADFHGTRLQVAVDGDFETTAGFSLSSAACNTWAHISIKPEKVSAELQRRIDAAARALHGRDGVRDE